MCVYVCVCVCVCVSLCLFLSPLPRVSSIVSFTLLYSFLSFHPSAFSSLLVAALLSSSSTSPFRDMETSGGRGKQEAATDGLCISLTHRSFSFIDRQPRPIFSLDQVMCVRMYVMREREGGGGRGREREREKLEERDRERFKVR